MVDLGGSSFLYSLTKDLWRKFRGHRRSLTPERVLELRQKWKRQFEAEVAKNYREKLRPDVIIRDVKRLDHYPETTHKARKRPSAWYRAGLMDTYDKGVMIGLRWGELTNDVATGKWRFTNYDTGEKGDIHVVLIGTVVYENIEVVDWDGDGYYHFPHIYCHFDGRRKGTPYDQMMFCEQRSRSDMPPFYVEVATFDEVKELSHKRGAKWFG